MLPNSEWILLAILVVILLKPDDIPAIARFLGKIMHKTNQMWDVFNWLNKKNPSLREQKLEPFHCAPPKSRIQAIKD